MHSLDNVIWQALTTRQTEFAEAFGQARRFIREVSPLAAFTGPNDEAYASLASLLRDDEVAWLSEYHHQVRERLTPLVSEAALAWLQRSTQPL